jgi:hypothetical protein
VQQVGCVVVCMPCMRVCVQVGACLVCAGVCVCVCVCARARERQDWRYVLCL